MKKTLVIITIVALSVLLISITGYIYLDSTNKLDSFIETILPNSQKIDIEKSLINNLPEIKFDVIMEVER